MFHIQHHVCHVVSGVPRSLQAALSYAKEEGLKVILTCTYLQHYVTKHEEHIDIVLK